MFFTRHICKIPRYARCASFSCLAKTAARLRIVSPGISSVLTLQKASKCHAAGPISIKESNFAASQIAMALVEEGRVQVHWNNGKHAGFHHIWLRDHCLCEQCLNPSTHQREVDLLKVSLDIVPKNVEAVQDKLHITWPDGHSTTFESQWLARHAYSTNFENKKEKENLILWDKKQITSTTLPNFSYDTVLSNKEELFKLSNAIIKFGFAFVNDTPTVLSAIEQLAHNLGGFVRETNFGGLWQFSNEVMAHADTAYTSGFLQAHTDNTYFTDPSGLQMLHCIHHDGTGGESLLVDGFYAAEMLKQQNNEAFNFLSSKILPFRYIDDNLYLKAHGPTIELEPFSKELMHIRYNLYDREIMDSLDADDVPKYYEAIKAFASIICSPDSEYWFKLVPGKLLVMANWRVMHGRSGFTGKRQVQGCYVNRDDFLGRYRSNLLGRYQNELI